MRRGRIVDLQKRTFKSCTITQGIPKEEQPAYDNSNKFVGGCGTYAHDFETETSYIMKVVVYADEENPKSTVTTDITDLINNTLGGILGIALYVICSKIFRSKTTTIFQVLCSIGTLLMLALLTLLIVTNL